MKVITNCIASKTKPTELSIKNIQGNNLDEIFTNWVSKSKGDISCIDLYTGRQWDMIKNISKTNEILVLSAGYGLININHPVLSYEITFSTAYQENKDILIPTFGKSQKQSNKEWFNKFNTTFDFNTDETIIITLNDDYLNVLDIPKKDNIIILSKYKLGRLAKWLGTGANDLKVKFTEYLINNYPNLSGNKELKSIIADLESKYGEDLYQKRQKVSTEFIIDLMIKGWDLNKIRGNNFKCSKERYKLLKETHNL